MVLLLVVLLLNAMISLVRHRLGGPVTGSASLPRLAVGA
jgi:hypothetical protein